MSNSSAFLTGVARPLIIEQTEIPIPSSDEVIIKNSAVAFNPFDSLVQKTGFLIQKYPLVIGHDAAGTVVAKGDNVQDFNVGDRVLALAEGLFSPDVKNGAFQIYFAAKAVTTSHIPDKLSFVDASVFPLCIFTAAAGLFHSDHLNLELPEVPAPQPKNKSVLIWGGASGVGANAIQLAVASGYTVFATCSQANADYVTSLGAAHVFDYRSESIVEDISSLVESDKNEFQGIFIAAASGNSFNDAASALKKLSKPTKLASAAVYPKDFSPGIQFSWTNLGVGNLPEEMIKIARGIFDVFLPRALEAGTYAVAPPPQVIGESISSIQDALDTMAKGVSAKKLVIKV